jgi:zinc protease
MKIRRKLYSNLLLFVLIAFSFQGMAQIPEDLTAKIPVDQKIKTGVLENGLKYYIRENKTPKNRAELRLVVNAGSLLEDEDQRGLAHFCEHMAFNGTKNFEKHALINFLESIGMKFGAELNAYTSFDETVYMLTIPMDKEEYIDTGFQILSDWAYNVSYEGEEIDKERGVIHEEWRLGQGAQDRMSRQYLPLLFYKSKYAERLPIGKMSIVDKCPHDALRRFYKDWYRPDLMAVIAVGDFKTQDIENYIKKYFSVIPVKEDARKREVFTLPDHEKPLVKIVADSENPYSMIQVYYKQDKDMTVNHKSYRENLIKSLYSSMLNSRLNEKMQESNPPALFMNGGYTGLVRTKDAFMLMAVAKRNQSMESFEMLMTENERVARHGFTASELERQKVEMLKMVEKLYKERDKQKSLNYAGEYQRNYLQNESIPGIEYEYELYKAFLPTISLSEVNALSKDFVSNENMVIIMTFPEKKGIDLPKEKAVLQMLKAVKEKEDIEAYKDEVIEAPLISKEPTGTKVQDTKEIKVFDATEWTLGNGVKVVLKKTDFKNEEILMSAYSLGGQSLYSMKDDVSAGFAGSVINQSGLGQFDNTQLEKMLTGKNVSVYPYISNLEEGLQGSTTPEDFETLMQLTYLYFMNPRKDEKAYNNFIEGQKEQINFKGTSPDDVFSDTISVVMSNYHERRMPLSLESLKEANLDRIMEIYKDRFSNADDFTFFFVGNFDEKKIKPLIEKYLGALPATKRKEKWVDLGVEMPRGKVEKVVYKGTEPKSTVFIAFPGTYEYSQENNVKLQLMVDALNIRLRENIREEQSGVYGIQAWANKSHYPKENYYVGVYFGCAPENVDRLVKTVFEEIGKMQKEGALEVNVSKVKESTLRSLENNLRENKFWLRTLKSYYFNERNFDEFNAYEDLVKSVQADDLKEYAEKYINTDEYIKIVLMPESEK